MLQMLCPYRFCLVQFCAARRCSTIDFWFTSKVHLFNRIAEIISRLFEQQLAYCGFFLHRRTHHTLIDALNSCVRNAVGLQWTWIQKKIIEQKTRMRFSTSHTHTVNRWYSGLTHSTHILSYPDCRIRNTMTDSNGTWFGIKGDNISIISIRINVAHLRAPLPVLTDEFASIRIFFFGSSLVSYTKLHSIWTDDDCVRC